MIQKNIRMKKNKLYAVDFNKNYSFEKAVFILKKQSSKKFIESVDVSISLNINTKYSDQNIRGTVVLPYGNGKNNIVGVFAQGKNFEIAKSLGADFVGMEDLFEKIKNGFYDFNVIISTPEAMSLVSQLGAILGPRNLMPNPKFGTVTENIADAVKDAKLGQIFYKNDKNGIIHSSIGKIDFSSEKIKSNLEALINSIKKNKPPKIKQFYIKNIFLSTTMGIGIKIKNDNL